MSEEQAAQAIEELGGIRSLTVRPLLPSTAGTASPAGSGSTTCASIGIASGFTTITRAPLKRAMEINPAAG